MAPSDTSAESQRRVSTIFASMTGPERVVCAAEMAAESKAIALAGIRSRHPELTEAEVAVEWIRLLHGDDIAGYAARCNSSS